MIKLIGLKRFVALVLVLIVNLVIVGGYFIFLNPMLQTVQTELLQLDSELPELRTKLDNVKQELAYLKENAPKYESLKERGYFKSPDQFDVAKKLEAMRTQASLPGFSFTVGEPEFIPHSELETVAYKLMKRRVEVKVANAPFDSSFYLFSQGIADGFSMHAHLQALEVQRTSEINKDALRSISQKLPAGFIGGTVSFDLITMVPQDQIPVATEIDPNTGAPLEFRGR